MVYISDMGFNDVIPDVGSISESGGLTSLRASPDVPISIWYDITDAAGRHWTVKDKDWQDIYCPRQVILYHELSHAYRDLNGSFQTKRQ
jgi:hypothetical protein